MPNENDNPDENEGRVAKSNNSHDQENWRGIVRQQEQGKVSLEMDALRNSNATLQQQHKDLQTLITENERKITESKENDEKTNSAKKDKEKKMNDEFLKQAETMNERMARLEKHISDNLKEQQVERLATLKSQLISAANGEIIPEMVSGNSEEEIRASVEASKETYKRIVAPKEKQAEAPAVPANPSVPGTGVTVSSTKGVASPKTPDEVDSEYIRKMQEIREQFPNPRDPNRITAFNKLKKDAISRLG